MVSAPTNCFHCSDAITADTALFARVAGKLQPVCCIGCQAACEWIGGLGLSDYFGCAMPQRRAPLSRPI